MSQAHAIKAHFKEKGEVQSLYEGLSVPKVAALCFFEASTRTRFSFEAAAFRLGLQTMTLSDVASSSQSKGETYSDTLSTIAAMQPDVIVCRSTDEVDMAKHSERLGCPFVNAGRGQFEHPTQALLDMMTIQESFSQTAGLKFVFVGDVAHSRVAASNLFLLQSMGVEVAICAPRGFLPAGEAWSQLKKFETVHEAADWADVVMALRIQLERGADPMTADELSKFQAIDFQTSELLTESSSKLSNVVDEQFFSSSSAKIKITRWLLF